MANCSTTRNTLNGIAALALFLVAIPGCSNTPRKKMPEWTKSRVLAARQDHPEGIALDDKFVYYTTGGMLSSQQQGTNNVCKVPIEGGEVIVLARGEKDWLPDGTIALDEKFVYFTASGRLMRVPKEGGQTEAIATGLGAVKELVIEEDRIYLLNFRDIGVPVPIQMVSKQGGAVLNIVENQVGSNDLQSDGDFIYWMTPAGLMKAKKDGSEPTNIYAAGEGLTVRLALDADNFYFTQGEGRQELMKLSRKGGAPVRIATSVNQVHNLVVDDSSVYYFDNENIPGDAMGGLALRKVSKSGGSPVTLDIGGGGWIGNLAVGQTNLFFKGIAEIYSIPK